MFKHNPILFFSSKDEKVQNEALAKFYKESINNEQRIKKFKRFARIYYPVFCVAFILGFWILGFNNISSP